MIAVDDARIKEIMFFMFHAFKLKSIIPHIRVTSVPVSRL